MLLNWQKVNSQMPEDLSRYFRQEEFAEEGVDIWRDDTTRLWRVIDATEEAKHYAWRLGPGPVLTAHRTPTRVPNAVGANNWGSLTAIDTKENSRWKMGT